jgi:hypothetical protein
LKGLEDSSAVDAEEEAIEKSMVMRVINVAIEGAILKMFLKSSWQLTFALS